MSGSIKIPNTKIVVERFKLLQARENELSGVTGHALADALLPDREEWAELRSIINQKFRQNMASPGRSSWRRSGRA